MLSKPSTPTGVLEAVKSLVPEIKRLADTIESQQKSPPELTQQLKDAGVFRMMLPRIYGGEELHPVEVARVIETLSHADGSTGWMGMLLAGFNIMLGHFSTAAIKQVLAAGPDVLVRGGIAPKGAAARVAGGYQVKGRWSFASGNYDHQWVMGNCMVFEDGKMAMGADGAPLVRAALVPKESAEFLKTWDVIGLRGTASDDFVIADVFVPELFTTDLNGLSNYEIPFHRLPLLMKLAPFHGSALLGMAQGALDDLADLATTKRPAFGGGKTLGSDPIFAYRFGELIVRARGLRAYIEQTLQQNWELANSGKRVGPDELARTNAMASYVQLQAVDITNEAFTLAGGTACYNSFSLGRRLRDVRCAAQHVAASTGWYQMVGSLRVEESVARSAA